MEKLKQGDQLYWYCVRTTYHDSGKIEREIVLEDGTNVPYIVRTYEKPLDECYSRSAAVVYYTYHHGYEEALGCLKSV